MKVKGIDVEATFKKVERVLSEGQELSPAIRSMVELLIFLITPLANL